MIYEGRCKKEDTKQLLDVLNDVFFFEDEPETKRNFLELLPKLYKDKFEPAFNNFIVAEDGAIKASIGLYPMKVIADGKEIKVGGIGNVAVSRDSRGKGYMINCMNQCLDQMKGDGTVVSVLGGHRQRYGYFGYEPLGPGYRFTIQRRNIAHIKGKDYKTPFTAKKLTPDDVEDLKKIKELNDHKPIYTERPLEDMFDIMCSWRNEPYSAYCGDKFVGYFAKDKFNNGCCEIKTVNVEDTIDLILCALDVLGKDELGLDVAPFETELADYMMKYCNGSDFSHSEMANVLDYKKFIDAFLGAKAARLNLGSGSLVLLIHGYRKDEQLRITVSGKKVTVEETDEKPDIELEHFDAMRLIAGVFGRYRTVLPDFAQGWFPVDFYCCSTDNV